MEFPCSYQRDNMSLISAPVTERVVPIGARLG